MTPGGKPASTDSSANFMAVRGVTCTGGQDGESSMVKKANFTVTVYFLCQSEDSFGETTMQKLV